MCLQVYIFNNDNKKKNGSVFPTGQSYADRVADMATSPLNETEGVSRVKNRAERSVDEKEHDGYRPARRKPTPLRNDCKQVPPKLQEVLKLVVKCKRTFVPADVCAEPEPARTLVSEAPRTWLRPQTAFRHAEFPGTSLDAKTRIRFIYSVERRSVSKPRAVRPASPPPHPHPRRLRSTEHEMLTKKNNNK